MFVEWTGKGPYVMTKCYFDLQYIYEDIEDYST